MSSFQKSYAPFVRLFGRDGPVVRPQGAPTVREGLRQTLDQSQDIPNTSAGSAGKQSTQAGAGNRRNPQRSNHGQTPRSNVKQGDKANKETRQQQKRQKRMASPPVTKFGSRPVLLQSAGRTPADPALAFEALNFVRGPSCSQAGRRSLARSPVPHWLARW